MLKFEARVDGLRVLRSAGEMDVMIASVTTQCVDADASKVCEENKFGATTYSPLPIDECSVHASAGPLTVAELEEIIAYLRSLAK